MCGSGTTINVAKELKRKVIGYDLNIVRPDVTSNTDIWHSRARQYNFPLFTWVQLSFYNEKAVGGYSVSE